MTQYRSSGIRETRRRPLPTCPELDSIPELDLVPELVEVAEGQVEVAPTPDGPAVPVPAGHYLIVGASELPRVVAGRLVWRLEPAKRGAYEPTFP